MSYIEQFLGKKADELTYQDIEYFFQVERDENDKLEFKSHFQSDTKIYENLLECICAFLNSSGGLLIWGAPKESPKTIQDGSRAIKIKSCMGPLQPVTHFETKETFINRVTDKINPSPNSIRFYRKEFAQKFVYLIEVEQSPYSPHQYLGRYLMRIDAATIPAPHHYVEALFRKITYPQLRAYISLSDYRSVAKYVYIQLNSYVFNMSKSQNENGAYYRIVLSNGVKFSAFSTFPEQYMLNGSEYNNSNRTERVYYTQPLFNSQEIKIDFDELRNYNNQFQVMLVAGGEHSPAIV